MRTNFNMQDENITMVIGDTLSFNVFVSDREGNPVMVDSAAFTCKKVVNDATGIFQKDLEDGITQDDTGMITVRVAPEDTASLYAGLYFYDMEIGVDDDIFTLLRGVLTLEQDITTNAS